MGRAQHFALCFPLLPIISPFFSSLGGLLVEFLVVVEAPGALKNHVWSSLGHLVGARAAQSGGGRGNVLF